MTSGGRATTAAAVLLIACVFVVDPGGLSPSGPARFAAIAAVLGGWAAITGLVTIVLGRPPGWSAVDGRVWGSWGALLVLTAASVLAGVDRWHGVVGTPERNLGLLSWIGFAVAFALGASLPSDADEPLGVAATVAVAGLSTLAAAERLGVDPTNTAWSGSRVGAPFAQSTYLAVALVLLGPPAAAAALDARYRPTLRCAAGVATVAGTVALAATGARGPLLGLGLAILAVLAARGQTLVGVGGAASALLAVVAVSVSRGWGSVGGRLDEWRVGWRGVSARPFLGYGPEGYRAAFPRLVDADYVRANGASVITDRAHHVLLDVALSSGAVAAVVLVGLWSLVGRSLLSRLRSDDAGPFDLGLAVAVAGGFLQQLVLFPLAELDPILWLFAGILVGRTAVEAGAVGARPGTARILPATMAAVGAAAMAGSFWWNATSAVAEHRFAQATSFRQATREQAADDALALRPESVRLAYATAVVHANGPTLVDLDEALSVLEAALDRHPDDPALRTEYVFELVERAGRSGLQTDFERAVEVSSEATAAAPNSPQLLGANAEALLLADRIDEARDQVRRALELTPDDPDLRSLADSIEKS